MSPQNSLLEDVQEKFLVFQECVTAWMQELDADLHALANVKESLPEKPSKVIPFPKRRGKPHETA